MEKMLQARVQIKRDTEANWNNVASTFVPKAGEFIVYVMTSDGENRIKIGDGTTSVGSLNFVDDGIRTLVDNLGGAVTTIQVSLDSKAPLNNANLTGTPTAPTASAGTNNTQIATTAFVANAVASIGGGGTEVVVSPTQPSSQDVGGLWFKEI